MNATQGLNGAADNILVLCRERGKSQATLIGDGRELMGIELTLQFDATTGAWTQIETTADQPKTPERAEILDLLKASAAPLSTGQIAKALGKSASTISGLLTKLVRDGDIKMVRYGKYIPVESAESAESRASSHLKKGKKKDRTTLFDVQEGSPSSLLSALSAHVQEDEPEESDDEAGDDTSYDPFWQWRDDYQPDDEALEEEASAAD